MTNFPLFWTKLTEPIHKNRLTTVGYSLGNGVGNDYELWLKAMGRSHLGTEGTGKKFNL